MSTALAFKPKQESLPQPAKAPKSLQYQTLFYVLFVDTIFRSDHQLCLLADDEDQVRDDVKKQLEGKRVDLTTLRILGQEKYSQLWPSPRKTFFFYFQGERGERFCRIMAGDLQQAEEIFQQRWNVPADKILTEEEFHNGRLAIKELTFCVLIRSGLEQKECQVNARSQLEAVQKCHRLYGKQPIRIWQVTI